MSNNRNTYSSSRHNYGWWDLAELIYDLGTPKCTGNKGVVSSCESIVPEKPGHITKEGAKEWCAQHSENPTIGFKTQCRAETSPNLASVTPANPSCPMCGKCAIFPHGDGSIDYSDWGAYGVTKVNGPCYHCTSGTVCDT